MYKIITDPSVEFSVGHWQRKDGYSYRFSVAGKDYTIHSTNRRLFEDDLAEHFEGQQLDQVFQEVDHFIRFPAWALSLEDDEGKRHYIKHYYSRREAEAAIKLHQYTWRRGMKVVGMKWLFVTDDGNTEIRVPVTGGEDIITRKGGLQ